MALKDRLTQISIDWIETLYKHEGASSGEIANLMNEKQRDVKAWMKWAELQNLGDYTIQDGMFHFWFNPGAKQEISAWKR